MIRRWFRKMFFEEGERIIRQAIDESFKVKFLERVQKMDVKDGDILVVYHESILKDPNTFREAFESIIHEYGFNVYLLLLQEGMRIGEVLTKKSQREQ